MTSVHGVTQVCTCAAVLAKLKAAMSELQCSLREERQAVQVCQDLLSNVSSSSHETERTVPHQLLPRL